MKKKVLIAFILGAVVAAVAVSYTNLYSVHLLNSLIDGTPIGLTTPASAGFTTVTASGGVTANLTGNASSASVAPWAGLTGKPYPVTSSQTWVFSGNTGQPAWLFGTNDGNNIQVWNPSNFNVAFATTSGGIANLKILNFSGLCTASPDNHCASSYTIPGGGYGDNNYVATCTILNPFGFPAIDGWGPVTGSVFQVSIHSGTASQAVSSGGAGLSCVLYHP